MNYDHYRRGAQSTTYVFNVSIILVLERLLRLYILDLKKLEKLCNGRLSLIRDGMFIIYELDIDSI